MDRKSSLRRPSATLEPEDPHAGERRSAERDEEQEESRGEDDLLADIEEQAMGKDDAPSTPPPSTDVLSDGDNTLLVGLEGETEPEDDVDEEEDEEDRKLADVDEDDDVEMEEVDDATLDEAASTATEAVLGAVNSRLGVHWHKTKSLYPEKTPTTISDDATDAEASIFVAVAQFFKQLSDKDWFLAFLKKNMAWVFALILTENPSLATSSESASGDCGLFQLKWKYAATIWGNIKKYLGVAPPGEQPTSREEATLALTAWPSQLKFAATKLAGFGKWYTSLFDRALSTVEPREGLDGTKLQNATIIANVANAVGAEIQVPPGLVVLKLWWRHSSHQGIVDDLSDSSGADKVFTRLKTAWARAKELAHG